MSGNENKVEFSFFGKKYTFTEGKKVEIPKDADKVTKKTIKAIAKSDGNRKLSEKEIQAIQNLNTVWGTGNDDNAKVNKAAELYNDAKAKAKANAKGKRIKTKDVGRKLVDELVKTEAPKVPAANTGANQGIKHANKVEEEKDEKKGANAAENGKQTKANEPKEQKVEQKPAVQKTVKVEDPYNKRIQEQAKAVEADKLAFEKKYSVKYGDTLYKIAKRDLGGNPKTPEIEKRMAEIVAANKDVIRDINNLCVDTVIRLKNLDNEQAPEGVAKDPVATPAQRGNDGAKAPVTTPAPQGNKAKGGAKAPAKTVDGVTVPEITYKEGEEKITVKPDPETKGWLEETIEGLVNGVKAYFKGEGDNKETKYVYNQNNITFEASTQEEMNAKAEKLDDAIASFSTPVEGETAEEAAKRLQDALNTVQDVGTTSALKYVFGNLDPDTQGVDYVKSKHVALIKTADAEIINTMLAKDGNETGNLQALIENNPDAQIALGQVYAQLKAKYENSTITLEEQKLRKNLQEQLIAGKVGAKIEAAEAQAEVTDEKGEVTTPAKEKVFEKTMITDKDGKSYWKADFELKSGTNLTLNANSPEELNKFMLDLEKAKATDKNDELKALFGSYSTTKDAELLKSLAANANELRADVDQIIKIIDNPDATLDTIYAIKLTNNKDYDAIIYEAKNARIAKIMANEQERKLPGNAKYLDQIQGLNIEGKSTELIKLADISDWESSEEKYKLVDGQYVLADDGDISVTKYTKDGETVYEMYINDPITNYKQQRTIKGNLSN